jgi:hypothetical protein
VVSGWFEYNECEVVDLSGNKKDCPAIANHPSLYDSIGTFIGGRALTCGGTDDGTFGEPGFYMRECLSYDNVTNTWIQDLDMLSRRSQGAGVMMSDTEWWVSGGYNGNDETTDSERYASNGTEFSSFIPLPDGDTYHVMLKHNDTQYVMVGGFHLQGDVFLFNTETELWTPLDPPMPTNRNSPFAGIVTHQDGKKELVVAGGCGESSSEIYSFESLSWRTGPVLPIAGDLCFGASVQYENTFLVVGGGNVISGEEPDIYKYDPDNESWITLAENLKNGRERFAAFLVPNDYIQCN